MSLINSLRKQLDRPVWEWMRFAPAVSSALSCSTTAQNSNFNAVHGRYIYYLIGAAFWKYDTWTDMYVGLTPPPTAVATLATMRFLSSYGVEGRAIAATASSITIPGYFGQVLKNYDISIIAGTGAGQRRVISGVADPVVADSGVVTAATAASITDATKSWSINQYAGYQIRVEFGSGISQVRRILYNSATVLTFSDTTKYPEDTFCQPAAPSPAFASTAGSQTIYQIESSVVSVDQNWTTTPDTTSRFRIASGAIVLMSGAVTAVINQWYDVATDTWYTKSCPTLVVGVTATDASVEVSDESTVIWSRGFATGGGTTTTLIDSTQAWTTNQWAGYWVFVAYGTAAGQMKKVVSNTATALTFAAGTAPDTTSSYMILGFDGGTATSGGTATLTDTAQAWATNRYKNFAVRILAGTGAGQVLPILSNTSTVITTVRAWATQPDSTSVYSIMPNQDQANFVLGANASLFCYGIDDDMIYSGRWNDSGVCRIGSVQFGSMKPQALAAITFSTTTATATTVNPIGFPSGTSVTIAGATGADATKYNGTFTVTITGANTFTYTMSGTPGANAVFGTITSTVLIDATKNWGTNALAGMLCHMTFGTTAAPIGQTMVIASNTSNTITLAAALTSNAINGVTRYVISPNTMPGALIAGTATGAGQLTTALVDTSQSWVVNLYAGRKVRFTGGAGESQEATITSNTATTLTFAAVTVASVAGSTTYAILAQPVRGLGITIRHCFGTSDAANKGKYLIVDRGGAVLGFDRLNLTTDTFEMMAVTPQGETLTTGSMFAYDGGDRIYFTKEVTQRVYYLDVVQSQIHGAGIYPYVAGTAIIGNRMEIFTTADGLKFVWLNRHSNLECFRTLLFW